MWIYTLIPVMAAMVGAALAAWRAPGPKLTSAIQHFAAGVVFAAAAGELLPDLVHRHSMQAIVVGGALGLVVMLIIRWLGERSTGSSASPLRSSLPFLRTSRRLAGRSAQTLTARRAFRDH
jgi:zinc transporter, ZIP family